MCSQLPELPVLYIVYAVTCIAVTIVISRRSQGPNLDAIPAVGSNNWLGSRWAGVKSLTNAQHIIHEGYEKYKSSPFKMAEFNRWTVILSDRAHLEEVAKAPDDTFALTEAINEQIRLEHTLGSEVQRNPYHNAVVRSHLNRNLEGLCPEMRDEVIESFADVLDLRGNEWKRVPAFCAIEKVVCRTSNRAFVGLPLCRNPEWEDLSIRCAIDLMTGGVIIGLCPEFMRSLAVRLLTKVPRCISRGMRLLGPIIEERLRFMKEYGTEWDDKPNDLLSWLMDEGEASGLTVEDLTKRVLLVNFAAIHTSSNSFTQALFYLAANPHYIQPLREEVEGVVEQNGWSKAALSKMRKVDSFLKESQRIEGVLLASLMRKVLKDFTLSDGTLIPKGTMIAAASCSLHHDKKYYEDPDSFEPFRFAHIPEEGSRGPKYQYASTSTEYLSFGHGKHACPGRFFAASLLKLMLAHIVVTYDVKLEDGALYPPNWHIRTFVMANPYAKVMFRKRVD